MNEITAIEIYQLNMCRMVWCHCHCRFVITIMCDQRNVHICGTYTRMMKMLEYIKANARHIHLQSVCARTKMRIDVRSGGS